MKSVFHATFPAFTIFSHACVMKQFFARGFDFILESAFSMLTSLPNARFYTVIQYETKNYTQMPSSLASPISEINFTVVG